MDLELGQAGEHVRSEMLMFGMGGTALMLGIFWMINGWVQGMGWPPCGKSMVHWFGTRERGLGGDEASLARSLEHRRAIPHQLLLHSLERRDARVDAREVLLDRGDDAVLLGGG